jgi:hypothetical protein
MTGSLSPAFDRGRAASSDGRPHLSRMPHPLRCSFGSVEWVGHQLSSDSGDGPKDSVSPPSGAEHLARPRTPPRTSVSNAVPCQMATRRHQGFTRLSQPRTPCRQEGFSSPPWFANNDVAQNQVSAMTGLGVEVHAPWTVTEVGERFPNKEFPGQMLRRDRLLPMAALNC